PAARRGNARRAAPRRPSRAGLEPLPVLLDDLAVELDAAAVPEVLDHVPVDGALVLAADLREAGADRQVDRPLDLLVEECVLHVPLDAGVAADSELAEPPCALVGVEHAEQELLVRGRRRLDDRAALEAEADAADLVADVAGRVLGVGDDALRR